MYEARKKAIKQLQRALKKGFVNKYFHDNVKGYKKNQCPNNRLFVAALAISQSKDYDDISDQIVPSFDPHSAYKSFDRYPKEYTLNLTLEEIAQIISKQKVLLDLSILHTITHRMSPGISNLERIVYYGQGPGPNRVFTSHPRSTEREPFEAIYYLGEAFAASRTSIDNLPPIALEDPKFIYGYLSAIPIVNYTVKANGEEYKANIYNPHQFLSSDSISFAIKFVNTAQAKLTAKQEMKEFER